MTHKNVFVLSGVVLLIFGLVWFLIPNVGLGVFGHDVQVNDLPAILTRYWGSAFIAIAVILWLARNGQSDSIAVKAITYGGFVLAVTGLVAAVIDFLYGNPNAVIWLSIGLYALFALLYGILVFKKA